MRPSSLLRSYLREAVIDANERFKKKRADDMKAKLQGVADGLPDAFAEQERLEKDVNARLDALSGIPDELVSRRRLRMAVPSAFDIDDGWGPDASVFDIVSFTYDGEGSYQELSKFVRDNAAAFQRAAQDVTAGLKEVEEYADSMEWPAPWRRYTRYGEALRNVTAFRDNVNKMLRA